MRLKKLWAALARPASPRGAGEPVVELVARCQALISESGGFLGNHLAKQVVLIYQLLEPPAREVFFTALHEQFSPDPARITRAAERYCAEPSEDTLKALQAAVEPPRQELFRRLNLAPGGTAALLQMRGHLLTTLKDHPERAGVDSDLAHILRAWFNGGFLALQRIDWGTPADVLERLIRYEAVHQIQGWNDLRRRLEADRRCYALFHPALPGDPIIFIEVALTATLNVNVQSLLDADSKVRDPLPARCAVFYSITNCHEGLRGVSLGNLLIKQVVSELQQTFPRLRTFATLSPIPGFRRWLEDAAPAGASAGLSALLKQPDVSGSLAGASAELRAELIGLCAHYLLNAKRGKYPLDSVARFHLSNGASIERINWLGDVSTMGVQRSFGLTANYVYRPGDLERNHEAYAQQQRVVTSARLGRASASVGARF